MDRGIRMSFSKKGGWKVACVYVFLVKNLNFPYNLMNIASCIYKLKSGLKCF